MQPQEVHARVAADRFAQSRLRNVIPSVFSWARPSTNRSTEQCGHTTRFPATVKGWPLGASPIAYTPRLTAVKKFPKLACWLTGPLDVRANVPVDEYGCAESFAQPAGSASLARPVRDADAERPNQARECRTP